MKSNTIYTLAFVGFFTLFANVSAQSPEARLQQAAQVDETTATFAKKVKPSGNALTVVIEGNATEIQTVLDEKFAAGTGEKVKNFKGLQAVEAVVFPDISPKTLDYYYRVEPVENTSDKFARITMFVSAGYYNFLDSEKFPEEMQAASTFLQNLDRNTKIYKLEQLLTAQTEAVAQEQKAQEDLIANADKVAKELSSQQDEITKMNEEIAKLQAKVTEAQSKMEQMKASQTANQTAMDAQTAKVSEAVAKLQEIQQALEALKN